MGFESTYLSHIANLCSLDVSAEEREKFEDQINEIIDFVSKLQEIDVEGVEPLYHPIEENNMEINYGVQQQEFTQEFVHNVKHGVKDN